jgi:predicted CXXCH cytochrome family protein
MAREGSFPEKGRFSKVHLISIALIVIVMVILVGLLYLQDGEDVKETAICGEDCHSENFAGYNDPQENSFMAVHLEKDVDCWDCHQGEDVEDKEDESHGEITTGSCEVLCHRGVDWEITAPDNLMIWHPYTENGTDITNLDTLDNCVECHDPRLDSSGLGADTCTICHDISQEELEDHGEDSCSLASCHSDSPDMTINKTGHLEVEGHCNLCHNKGHPEEAFVPYTLEMGNETFTIDYDFCSSCHEDIKSDLNDTGGSHEVALCNQCHTEHDYEVDCTDCHDDSDIPHEYEGEFADCRKCHVRGGHEPVNLDFTAFSSLDISETFCGSSSCHREDVFDEVNEKFAGDLHGEADFDEDCIQCHDTHSENVQCFSCHDVKKEPEHDITAPFDDCTRCHVDGHDNSNITFYNFDPTELNGTFCEACHEGSMQEIENGAPEHVASACQTCHENARGEAQPPAHSVASPYNECTKCHDTAHDSKKISAFDVTFSNNDFCASCHTDPPMNQVSLFNQYGEGHKIQPGTCSPSCHSDHTAKKLCTTDSCHSGTSYPLRHPDYVSTECLDCHWSAHDPTNSAKTPGSTLSQKQYLKIYYKQDQVRMKGTFSWISRGNHTLGDPCTPCHESATTIKYPNSSLPKLNSSGEDCSQGCHGWIDPVSSSEPYALLSSSTSNHTIRIFNDASLGGCAGYCHQEDPSQPDYVDPEHGVITNCLDSLCHGGGFEGGNLSAMHRAHVHGLENTTYDCFSLCHTDLDTSDHDDCLWCHSHYAKYGTLPATQSLIEGGCYGCHKSGHDPSLLADNPCSECH